MGHRTHLGNQGRNRVCTAGACAATPAIAIYSTRSGSPPTVRGRQQTKAIR
jgi:hypothetical protein